MSASKFLPLFPLGIVLLPGNYLKLHVFEARYRDLVKTCIQERIRFGVIHYDGTLLHEVGTTARIIDIPRTWPDGRMDIVCAGKERFRIREIQEGSSFLQARISLMGEDPSDPEELRLLQARAVDLLESLSRGTSKPLDTRFLMQLEPSQLAYVLGNTDLLDHKGRQSLIETNNAAKRLGILIDNLRISLQRMEATMRIQDILGPQLQTQHLMN